MTYLIDMAIFVISAKAFFLTTENVARYDVVRALRTQTQRCIYKSNASLPIIICRVTGMQRTGMARNTYIHKDCV